MQTLLIFLSLLCGGCPELKTGDLLFQVEGSSEFSSAISASTSTDEEISFVHVGILTVDGMGKMSVIEASPSKGVQQTTLLDFISDSPKIDGEPGIVVKRINYDFPAEEAATRALSHLGEPYDWWYLPDNGKMYCSELVYESYLNSEGEHIFKAAPMRFRDSDGNMPEFWTRLFGELGMNVPEGVEGTNPNEMAKESCLTEVYRFCTRPKRGN